jgi:hypothetical protein
MKYSWYNIRTTISDEGYFYTINGFSPSYSEPVDSFQAMLKRPSSHVKSSDEIIAYWVIICQGYRLSAGFGKLTCLTILDWNIELTVVQFPDQDALGRDQRQAFLRFLLSSPFKYIAPFSGGLLDEFDLRMVVQALGWTAPMAALLLKRLSSGFAGMDLPLIGDSMTAAEADGDLVTSDEDEESEGEEHANDSSPIQWNEESDSGEPHNTETQAANSGKTDTLEETQKDESGAAPVDMELDDADSQQQSEEWGPEFDSQALAAATMMEQSGAE